MTTTISASQVKELRDKTSVGMMECKKALEESNGDIEAAIRVLRERGIAKAAKREGRTAAEGLIAVSSSSDMKSSVMAQLNSETDFVSRNEEFASLVAEVANKGLASGVTTLEEASALTLADGRTVQTAVDDLRTKIGEKIELSTFDTISGDVVSGYVHPPGKIGVLIAASAEGLADDKKAFVAEELRGVAMHIAAFSPRFLDSSEVNEEILNSEREIFAALARNEGKPEAIIPKIVDGKIRSFYKDNCLVDQLFAKDNSKSVGKFIEELGKQAGATLKLTGFKRVQIGSKSE